MSQLTDLIREMREDKFRQHSKERLIVLLVEMDEKLGGFLDDLQRSHEREGEAEETTARYRHALREAEEEIIELKRTIFELQGYAPKRVGRPAITAGDFRTRQLILADLAEGRSLRQVAKDWSVSKSAVHRLKKASDAR